jgi:hypothetical protein
MRHPYFFPFITALGILSLSLSTGCAVQNPIAKKPEPQKILELTQTCASACANFTLAISSDKKATFTGKSFTSMMGTYSKTLSDGQFDTLKSILDQANLWSLPDRFPVIDARAPYYKITVYERTHEQSASGQQFPPATGRLITHLVQLERTGGWKQVDKPVYSGVAEDELPNVVRVLLKPGLNHEYWQAKYVDYGMTVIRMLEEAPNYWLFRFDPSRIEPVQMRTILGSDPEVARLEFEKKPKANR